MPNVRDFAATESGGWRVFNGDFASVADQEAVQQGVRIRLRSFKADSWLDESQGIPYLTQIFDVKNPDPLLVRSLLQSAIEETPDVTAVSGVLPDIVGATRAATISFSLTSKYSTEPLPTTVEVMP